MIFFQKKDEDGISDELYHRHFHNSKQIWDNTGGRTAESMRKKICVKKNISLKHVDKIFDELPDKIRRIVIKYTMENYYSLFKKRMEDQCKYCGNDIDEKVTDAVQYITRITSKIGVQARTKRLAVKILELTIEDHYSDILPPSARGTFFRKNSMSFAAAALYIAMIKNRDQSLSRLGYRGKYALKKYGDEYMRAWAVGGACTHVHEVVATPIINATHDRFQRHKLDLGRFVMFVDQMTESPTLLGNGWCVYHDRFDNDVRWSGLDEKNLTVRQFLHINEEEVKITILPDSDSWWEVKNSVYDFINQLVIPDLICEKRECQDKLVEKKKKEEKMAEQKRAELQEHYEEEWKREEREREREEREREREERERIQERAQERMRERERVRESFYWSNFRDGVYYVPQEWHGDKPSKARTSDEEFDELIDECLVGILDDEVGDDEKKIHAHMLNSFFISEFRKRREAQPDFTNMKDEAKKRERAKQRERSEEGERTEERQRKRTLTEEDLDETPESILGVSKDASEDQVKDAFRVLAKMYHPDKYRKSKKFAEMAFTSIKKAFDEMAKKFKGKKYRTRK